MPATRAAPNANTTLVTANQRLAEYLQRRHMRLRQEAGARAWQTPNILAFHAWLRQCWLALRDRQWIPASMVLLNATQEGLLWRELFHPAVGELSLLDDAGAAEQARATWQLICDWRISPRQLLEQTSQANEDVTTFLRWLTLYRQRLREQSWQDQPALVGVIADHPQLGLLYRDQELVFRGFDQLTPAQELLFEALRKAGNRVTVEAPERPSAARVRQLGVTHGWDEEVGAATWARELLERDPALEIGVVAIDLAGRRDSLLRAFHEVFYPGKDRYGDDSGLAYNISLGQPLRDFPLIADALAILQLAASTPQGAGEIDLEQLCRVIRSPYLGAELESAAQRAGLEPWLRKTGPAQASLREYLRPLRDEGCARFLAALTRIRDYPLPRQAHPAVWGEHFSGVMERLGWPGSSATSGGGLNSAEYQQWMAWQELLAEFAGAGLVRPTMGLRDALGALQQLAGNTLFQPRSEAKPVQISGVLEATGQRFDALWVMGAQDDVWPAVPRPSPFLPHGLQKRLHMPHATPERQMEYAQAVTRRLIGSAAQVVFSHARREGDLDLLPSPLLREFPLLETPIGAREDFAQLLFRAAASEELADGIGLPRRVDTPMRGGTGLFRHQSECPFRAYAISRLQALAMEERQPGVDARERGELLHRALQVIWTELRDSRALRSLPDTELESFVDGVLGKLFGASGDALFQSIEKQRCHDLLLDWLRGERQRGDFTVEATELSLEVQIGELRISCRADRIDRLAGGAELIIDYKSGKVSVGALFDERLAEPQLPLYALHRPAVKAVSFAVLHPEHGGFAGVGEGALTSGIKALSEVKNQAGLETWEQLKHHWQQGLLALSEELRQGLAQVNPRKRPDTCAYCHLPVLCRVDEKQPLVGDDET